MITTLAQVPYDRSYEYHLIAYRSHDGRTWEKVYDGRSTPNDSPFAPYLATPSQGAPFVYEKWWKRKRGTREWKRHATMKSWP